MIPTVNLTIGKPQIFKAPHHKNFRRDKYLKLVDVALATSAAPTYFPVHNIDGQQYADGGLYANSPDELALHEAEYYLSNSTESIYVLSIGTTTSEMSIPNEIGQNLGIWGWAKDQKLSSIMIAAQQQNANSIMGHKLLDRYIRLDRSLSAEQRPLLGLDVADANSARELAALADATFRKAIANPKLVELLGHRGSPLVPKN